MSLLRRGVVQSYDAGTHTASVQMAGSLGVWLDGLRVATDIPPSEVIAGRECAVLLFTDDNPTDGVVVTVHGAVPAAPAGGTSVRDTDGDTKIEAEANPDEDILRFTVLGTLRYLIQSVTPHHDLTGDVRISGTTQMAAYGNQVGSGGATGTTMLAIRPVAGGEVVAGSRKGIDISPQWNPNAGALSFQALSGNALIAPSSGLNLSLYGLDFIAGCAGGAGISYTDAVGCRAQARVAIFGAAVTRLAQFVARTPTIAAASAVTTGFGLHVEQQGHALMTTVYGVKVEAITAGTNRRPFYDGGSIDGDGSGNRFRSNTQFASVNGAFGGGDGVIGIANASVEPGSPPAAGGILYSSGGQLKWLDQVGRIARLSPETLDRTLANGANQNVDPAEATLMRVTGPTGAFSVGGIAGGQTGRVLFIYNTTAQNMTLNNEDAGSTAYNRITTMTGAGVATTGVGMACLVYSGTDQRWLLASIQG